MAKVQFHIVVGEGGKGDSDRGPLCGSRLLDPRGWKGLHHVRVEWGGGGDGGGC